MRSLAIYENNREKNVPLNTMGNEFYSLSFATACASVRLEWSLDQLGRHNYKYCNYYYYYYYLTAIQYDIAAID